MRIINDFENNIVHTEQATSLSPWVTLALPLVPAGFVVGYAHKWGDLS